MLIITSRDVWKKSSLEIKLAFDKMILKLVKNRVAEQTDFKISELNVLNGILGGMATSRMT